VKEEPNSPVSENKPFGTYFQTAVQALAKCKALWQNRSGEGVVRLDKGEEGAKPCLN